MESSQGPPLLPETRFVLFEERSKPVEHLLSGFFADALPDDDPKVLLEVEPTRAAFAPSDMPRDDQSMRPTQLAVEVEVEVRDRVFAPTSTHDQHL
jgi:hypothetical protein